MFDDNQGTNQPAATDASAASSTHGFSGNDVSAPAGSPPVTDDTPSDVPSEEVTPPSPPTTEPAANDQPGAPEPPAGPTSTPADDQASDTPVDLPAPNPPTPDEETSDEPPADDTPAPEPDTTVAEPATDGDLAGIKQSALQQLSPLVGHLDQTPEEKFRTTMMMIQASDDQSLIKTAYEAAQQITDEKTKAQALLDVVNEINYFTHQPSTEEKTED